jgi:diguanylate cyclase (GGDEF)-like protein
MTVQHSEESKGAQKPKHSIFGSLLAGMLAFGAIVGVLFPHFAKLFIDLDGPLSVRFSLISAFSGILIGCINYKLFEMAISREMKRVADGMERINESVALAADSDDYYRMSQKLEATSDDMLGRVVTSFNRMSEAVARRIRIESTTRKVLAKLSANVELDAVSRTILEALATVCEARAGVLYRDSGNKLELQGSFGVDQTEQLPSILDVKQGLAFRALSTGDSAFVSTLEDGFEWMELSTPLGAFRPKSVLVVPLMADRRAVGLAVLASICDELSDAQRSLLQTISTQAAPYLQTAILHEKLQDLAAVDDLTRILNRRFGIRRLHEEFSRSVRHGVPLGVIMLDIDNFKTFNDTFGHDAGDSVLVSVANILESNLRSGDVVCRYGGEEFMVIAPGMGLNDVGGIAERLRRVVETTPVQRANQSLHVTVSLGAASWPVLRASTAEEIVTSADKALYSAKASGRNVVAVHNGDCPVPLSALPRDESDAPAAPAPPSGQASPVADKL